MTHVESVFDGCAAAVDTYLSADDSSTSIRHLSTRPEDFAKRLRLHVLPKIGEFRNADLRKLVSRLIQETGFREEFVSTFSRGERRTP